MAVGHQGNRLLSFQIIRHGLWFTLAYCMRGVEGSAAVHIGWNTPHESFNLASEISRKLGVFEWKSEGCHSIFHLYSDAY